MLFRGCARITPPSHSGADFILPLVSGDNQLGNILVQVKFVGYSFFENGYVDFNDKIGRMQELLKKINKMENCDSGELNKIASDFKNTISDFNEKIRTFNLQSVFEIKSDYIDRPMRKKNMNSQSNIPINNPTEAPNIDLKALSDSLPKLKCKEFPSMRLFINIWAGAVTRTSSVEFDQFGPILVIETNGDLPFLKKLETSMISKVINKARRYPAISQELIGQNVIPVEPRIKEGKLPTNPIYYKDKIDDDKTKLNLKYFGESFRRDLENIFDLKNRPKFLHNFDSIFKHY
jgi:hypothetical protein